MVAEDMSKKSKIQEELDDLQERAEALLEKKAKPRLPAKPYMGDGSTAKMYDRVLTPKEILKRAMGEDVPTSLETKNNAQREFDRKAAFRKLAFWLREYGYDDEMAQFIEKIALERGFARNYRIEKQLLRMMIKLFKAAEKLYKPFETENNTITEYTNRYKALQKETTSIRTFINRLLNTYRRGTKRKMNGGTRDESRVPDCCKDQA